MIKKQRLELIKKIVNKEGNVSVKYLSNILGHAESTVRSDLNLLDSNGEIVRVHGGAEKSIDSNGLKYVFFENRLKEETSEKQCIASKAIKLIKNDQSIALDGSTTCYELAKLISKSNLRLTVITNGLMVAETINNNSNVTTILIGGMLSNETFTTEGSFNFNLLDSVNINTYFFSARGINNKSLTDFDIYEVKLKSEIIKRSDKNIALLDNTKFGITSTSPICETKDIDLIISDDKINDSLIKEFKLTNINII